VSNAEFTDGLALAAESGVRYSGVLCGRATWKEGIPVFAKEGSAAFRAWLETKGVENIANVNEAVRPASPWFSVYGAASADALA
jgi:tagatose 1,6-diphosphate aldolase